MPQMYDTEVTEQDVGAMPMFYMKTVPDKVKSAETGADHFTEQEWIEIRVRGDNTTVVDVPVSQSHRKRFAASYAKFKEGKEQKYGDGYPLDQWALIGAPMVKTLNAQNVFTVEQLAEFPDTFMHKLHQGQTWKQRAIKWLGERNPDTEGLRDEVARLTLLVGKLQADKPKKKKTTAKRVVKPTREVITEE